MAKVFICYRRVDSGDAGRLQAQLRHVPGIELQFDINTIHAGEDFVDKLNAELAAADLMIVVISKTWVDALKARQDSSPEDFVELEVSTALRRRIPILPVRVQSAPPPTALELPGSMKGLATIQSIELRHERYDDDVAFLIGRLRDLLGLPSTSPATRRSIGPVDHAAGPPGTAANGGLVGDDAPVGGGSGGHVGHRRSGRPNHETGIAGGCGRRHAVESAA